MVQCWPAKPASCPSSEWSAARWLLQDACRFKGATKAACKDKAGTTQKLVTRKKTQTHTGQERSTEGLAWPLQAPRFAKCPLRRAGHPTWKPGRKQGPSSSKAALAPLQRCVCVPFQCRPQCRALWAWLKVMNLELYGSAGLIFFGKHGRL